MYYHEKYISKRDTLLLRNLDLNKAVDASMLNEKFKNLKWITHNYPRNPELEIQNLLETINIIKDDRKAKMIVTDYQFISVILSTYDNSPNKVWYSFHVYPTKNDAYFDLYQNDFYYFRL